MSSALPLHLSLLPDGYSYDALVGRRQVPLASADPGVAAQLDRAVTNHDGSVDGPLRSGAYLLVGDRLVLP